MKQVGGEKLLCPFSSTINSCDIPHSKPCKEAFGSGTAAERCVRCLITTHREDIDTLKNRVKKYISVEIHDDLWILRYLLSNGEIDKCVDDIKRAVAWRKENAEFVLKAKDFNAMPPYYEDSKKFVAVSNHVKTRKDGGPVFIVRSGISNPKKLMEILTYDQIFEILIFQKEQAYNMCDIRSRETGYLTKMTTINDFSGLSLLRAKDKKFMKALSESAKLAEYVHPQLMDKGVMINVNKVVQMLFSLLKMVMPRKTVAKMTICGASDTRTQNISLCPWVRENIEIVNVPTFLGGKCECPGGCVRGVPNDLTKHL
eukprot:CFRG0927T1